MADMLPQGVQAPHDGAGHEPDDLSVRAVVGFAAGLVVATGLVMAGIAGMMGYFSAEERQAETVHEELFKDPEGQYPGPQLQPNDARDMEEYRREEARQLSAYSWDPKARVAHLPIERAMDLLVKTGLPALPAAAPEAEPGPQ